MSCLLLVMQTVLLILLLSPLGPLLRIHGLHIGLACCLLLWMGLEGLCISCPRPLTTAVLRSLLLLLLSCGTPGPAAAALWTLCSRLLCPRGPAFLWAGAVLLKVLFHLL